MNYSDRRVAGLAFLVALMSDPFNANAGGPKFREYVTTCTKGDPATTEPSCANAVEMDQHKLANFLVRLDNEPHANEDLEFRKERLALEAEYQAHVAPYDQFELLGPHHGN